MTTHSPEDRATSVLRAKLREPKAKEEKGPSTRQLRVANMLQHAMSTVLDEGLLPEPELYPNGVAVQIFDVSVSPCLRYATFLWSVPLQSEIAQPEVYQQGRKKGEADHDSVSHLSPEDAAVVVTTAAALERCASRLKQLMLPHIKMKVCAHRALTSPCCFCL